MADFIEINFDNEQVETLLSGLAKRASDLSPAMHEISLTMLDAVKENFEQEGSKAEKWKPWSDAWHKRRERLKFTGEGNRILTLRGELASSITAQSDSEKAEVGTNKKYAATHQFGDDSRNIPARPFLVLNNDDYKEISDHIIKHLKEAY